MFGGRKSLKHFYIKKGSANSNMGITDINRGQMKTKPKPTKLSQTSKNLPNLENKPYVYESV